jgi:hypothetical protein
MKYLMENHATGGAGSEDAGSIGSGVEGAKWGPIEEEPVGVYVSVYANESQMFLIREALRVCSKS